MLLYITVLDDSSHTEHVFSSLSWSVYCSEEGSWKESKTPPRHSTELGAAGVITA